MKMKILKPTQKENASHAFNYSAKVHFYKKGAKKVRNTKFPENLPMYLSSIYSNFFRTHNFLHSNLKILTAISIFFRR